MQFRFHNFHVVVIPCQDNLQFIQNIIKADSIFILIGAGLYRHIGELNSKLKAVEVKIAKKERNMKAQDSISEHFKLIQKRNIAKDTSMLLEIKRNPKYYDLNVDNVKKED